MKSFPRRSFRKKQATKLIMLKLKDLLCFGIRQKDTVILKFDLNQEYTTFRHFSASSMQDGLSHGPSLMALAPTSLL